MTTGDLIDKIQDIEINEFIDNYYEKSSFSDILPEIINNLGYKYEYALKNSSYFDEITNNYSTGEIIFRGDSIVELRDGESLHQYYGGDQTKFNTLKHSSDGQHILLYDNNSYTNSSRKIVVLDAKNLELITTLEGKINQSVRSWLTSSGKRLFISTKKSCHVWNTEDGKILYTIPSTNHLFFTNDECKFAIIIDKSIEIRDVNTGKLLTSIDNINIRSIQSRTWYSGNLFFSNDGCRIAIITDDGIEIRDVNAGKSLNYIDNGAIKVISKARKFIREFTFSKDGQRFVIQADLGIEVRDVNTGKLLMYVEEIRGCKYGEARFSTDGRMIAYPSNETIDLIDIETGELKRNLILPNPDIYDESVPDVLFSPDDRKMLTIMITSEYDGFACLWDLESGQLVKTIEDCQAFSFTEDSERIVSSTFGGEYFLISDACSGAPIDTLFYFDNTKDSSSNVVSEKWIDANSRLFRDIIDYRRTVNIPYKGKVQSTDKFYTTLVTTDNNMFHLYDIKSGNLLYSLVTVDSSDYLILHPDGYYDGTEAARNLLYFVCNGEIIDLAQVKDALYVPGLHEKIMTGQPINYKKLSELDICDALPVVKSLDDTKYHYQVKPRRLGLERVEVYVNDKRVRSLPVNELKKIEGSYDITLDEKELSSHFMAGVDNKVKVVGVARSEFGSELLSRGVVKTASGFKAKTVPRLFAVMIGINEYKDPSLRLNYPVKDALDLGRVLEASAVKMLGRENVFIYPINSDVKPGTGFGTPEKEGIRRALEDIGRKARPEDVVFLFFAGHGQMQGEDGKVFTFLTADASQLNPVGISTKELQEWLSYEGPHKMLANKTILIFDACNSGQATADLLAMARTDDETRRLRQVEDLKDKSGMFILAGAAPNQSAYELQQYEHGLLTYSLLSVMKNNPEILEDSIYLNLQKWFLDTEKTLKNLADKEGLKQDAKPLGTANIRMGIVDKEITDQIMLVNQKPKVYCDNVLDIETLGDDDLLLKEKVNSSLSAISERDGSGELLFTPRVTPDVCRINISYQIQGDIIIAKLRLAKGKETLHQTNITGSKNDLDGLVKMIVKEVREHAR